MIQIKDLSVYFGKYSALDNISFNVDNGTFVSILGPNGAGKSSLLRVILGLIKPDNGSIEIDGVNIENSSKDIIGYVPQVKTLDRSFPALPIELVATGIRNTWPGKISKLDKELAMKSLASVGADHIATRPLNKLSGGELQRVYMARSFVRQPRILLLDEPATGMDMLGETDLHKLIDDFKKNNDVIVMMVTHDWESALHHSDNVLLLNRELICYGSPEKAFAEGYLRRTFGHVGHSHEMSFGVKNHD